jgi:hypothetical protein
LAALAVDPAATAAALQSAGVDYVAQRLATVYQATNVDAAQRLMNQIVSEVRHGAGVQPLSDRVPGFPAAQCFSRTGPTQPPDAPATWRMMQWHFKCVARADRYAYTVFSDPEKDVMQQVGAIPHTRGQVTGPAYRYCNVAVPWISDSLAINSLSLLCNVADGPHTGLSQCLQ